MPLSSVAWRRRVRLVCKDCQKNSSTWNKGARLHSRLSPDFTKAETCGEVQCRDGKRRFLARVYTEALWRCVLRSLHVTHIIFLSPLRVVTAQLSSPLSSRHINYNTSPLSDLHWSWAETRCLNNETSVVSKISPVRSSRFRFGKGCASEPIAIGESSLRRPPPREVPFVALRKYSHSHVRLYKAVKFLILFSSLMISL
jgi:hypothetical protein